MCAQAAQRRGKIRVAVTAGYFWGIYKVRCSLPVCRRIGGTLVLCTGHVQTLVVGGTTPETTQEGEEEPEASQLISMAADTSLAQWLQLAILLVTCTRCDGLRLGQLRRSLIHHIGYKSQIQYSPSFSFKTSEVNTYYAL